MTVRTARRLCAGLFSATLLLATASVAHAEPAGGGLRTERPQSGKTILPLALTRNGSTAQVPHSPPDKPGGKGKPGKGTSGATSGGGPRNTAVNCRHGGTGQDGGDAGRTVTRRKSVTQRKSVKHHKNVTQHRNSAGQRTTTQRKTHSSEKSVARSETNAHAKSKDVAQGKKGKPGTARNCGSGTTTCTGSPQTHQAQQCAVARQWLRRLGVTPSGQR